MQPKLTFTVSSGGGYLVVNMTKTGWASGGGPIGSVQDVTAPPLSTRVAGNFPTSSTPRTATPDISSAPISGFYQSIFDGLTRAIGDTGCSLVAIEAPSLDLTDSGWYATTGAVGTTDPLTFTPTITGTSAYGRTFAVGDYVLWLDNTLVSTTYSYEINQIVAINGGAWTLQRQQPTSATGMACFSTPIVAHGAGVKIYRLIDQYFFNYLPASGPEVWRWPWENMTVAAVQAYTEREAPILVDLIAPSPAAANPGINTGVIGTAPGAWTPYTPTATVTNATLTSFTPTSGACAYQQTGKTVNFRVQGVAVLSAGGSIVSFNVTLPVTAKVAWQACPCGLYDNTSAILLTPTGGALMGTTGTVSIGIGTASAHSYQLYISGEYEAA